MKIAFIGQKGIPAISGGVEKHVDDLGCELVKQGHEVYVYARRGYTDKNLKEHRGVQIINLPSIRTKHLDAISHTFLACLDAAIRRDFDIIHFHSIGPSSLLWIVKLLKPNTPVVATFHTQCYFHKKWGKFAKSSLKFGEIICCRFADRVITVSKTLKEYAKTRHGVEAVYLPNGVYLPKNPEADKIKEEWGLEKGSYFLVVSRLINHKGIHYAIKAFNRLDTDKKLVIVGDGFFTDDYVLELEDLARENKNIIFTGAQSGDMLSELFNNAYLFIQPSESEGLSIALLEAMSYGLPVLVSDIPENKEAIEGTALTFKDKDVDDLAEKLNMVLNSSYLSNGHGKLAKSRVQDEYNWINISSNLLKIYKDVLDEKEFKRKKQ